jgi:hypothetical protein
MKSAPKYTRVAVHYLNSQEDKFKWQSVARGRIDDEK